MDRIPPSLLYLTIFNPTLSPTDLPFESGEDAEEQAHILFYTSRERAVSRDRMLRQVGLAKALINFSELFSEEVCNNVHAQSRRMVMVSPEPNFWIHACIELANTPRLLTESTKKQKTKKEIRKSKEQEAAKDAPTFSDFHDGSVHDLAVHANLIWGYEQFKLTHGSFTSILTNLGREALELQLERFFTVWAWSWEVEDGHDYGRHFGIPLHPLHRSLTPVLDDFSSKLPEDYLLFAISPSHIIPSTKFTAAGFPPVLSRHLLSQIPRPTNIHDQENDSMVDGPESTSPATTSHVASTGQGAFLRLPVMNLNFSKKVDMGVKKWGWPEYLTFRRSSEKKIPERLKMEQDKVLGQRQSDDDVKRNLVAVDRSALDDALTPKDIPVSTTNKHEAGHMLPTLSTSEPGDMLLPPNGCPATVSETSTAVVTEDPSSSADNAIDFNRETTTPIDGGCLSPAPVILEPMPTSRSDESIEPIMPAPTFSTTSVYLADSEDALATRKKDVFYIEQDQLTLFLIETGNRSGRDVDFFAKLGLSHIEQVNKLMNNGPGQSELDTQLLSSATKVLLEIDDKYIITVGKLAVTSPEFESRSEHLYNAQQLFKRNFDVSEVFSRSQNPQHWHIFKRGLIGDNGATVSGGVYMEVARKETSLTDVGNDVSNLVRKVLG